MLIYYVKLFMRKARLCTGSIFIECAANYADFMRSDFMHYALTAVITDGIVITELRHLRRTEEEVVSLMAELQISI